MKYKNVKIRRRVTVRHEAYIIDNPEVELEAEVEEGDNLQDVYKEVKGDVYYILNEMIGDCIKEYCDKKYGDEVPF